MRVEDIGIPRAHRLEALAIFVALIAAFWLIGFAAGFYLNRPHAMPQVVPIAELAKVGFKGSFGECEVDARERWTAVTLEAPAQ